MEKNFVVTYDSGLKKYAEQLESIVSEIADCKLVVYPQKMDSKQPHPDKQKYVYIGPKCSANRNFNSRYDRNGLQIGWKGSKCWIRISHIDDRIWTVDQNNESFQKEFWSSYAMLFGKYGLEKKTDTLLTKVQEWEKDEKKDVSFYLKKVVKFASRISSPWGTYLADKYIRDKQIKNSLYTFGILKFRDKYLHDFLNEEPKDL